MKAATKDINITLLKQAVVSCIIFFSTALISQFAGNAMLAFLSLLLLAASIGYVLFRLQLTLKSFQQNILAINPSANDFTVQTFFKNLNEKNFESEKFLKSLRDGTEPEPFDHLNKEKGIGQGLVLLKDQLFNYNKEEEKRKWAQNGLADLSPLLKSGNSLEEFSSTILTYLVKHLNANQGGIFVKEIPASGEPFLELKACYAYDKKKLLTKTIHQGEGLLGACMSEMATIFLADIPKGYMSVTSGVGEASPTSLLIVPLMFSSKFYGALELASFHIFEPYQIEMVEKVSAAIAAEIATKRAVFETERLLRDSQDLSTALQAQEEEIRQNMEELSATQEEMERKQAELSSVFSAINNTVASVEFDKSGRIVSANSIFMSISGYSEATVKRFIYHDLLSEKEKVKPQHDLMWSSLRDKQFFSGEFRFVDKNGQEMYLTGTFNPILNSKHEIEKIIMIAQFTTQDKVKHIELNSALTALKNTSPFVELDTNLKCKTANERFLKLFDLKRMELKNRDFRSFMLEDSLERFNSNFEIYSAQEYYEEILYFNPENPFGYRITFTPVRDLENRVVRYLVVFADKVYSNYNIPELV